MKKILAGIMVLTFVAGCATIIADAPAGASNTVSMTSQPSGSSVHFVAKKRVLYLLWGLIPITDNHTANEIATATSGKNAKNVTITSQYDIIDFLVSWIGSFVTLHCRSVKVEGDVVK